MYLNVAASEMSSEVSSGCSVRSRPTSQTSTDTLTCEDLPMGVDCPDMPPPPSNHPAHPPYRRLTRHSQHQHLLRAAVRESPPAGAAPAADYDALDPVEHHSSEEELETLTGAWGPPSEKRKWSQVAPLSFTDSGKCAWREEPGVAEGGALHRSLAQCLFLRPQVAATTRFAS